MKPRLDAVIIVRNGVPQSVTFDGCEIPNIESAVVNLEPGRQMSITLRIAVRSVVSVEKGDEDINGDGALSGT